MPPRLISKKARVNKKPYFSFVCAKFSKISLVIPRLVASPLMRSLGRCLRGGRISPAVLREAIAEKVEKLEKAPFS